MKLTTGSVAGKVYKSLASRGQMSLQDLLDDLLPHPRKNKKKDNRSINVEDSLDERSIRINLSKLIANRCVVYSIAGLINNNNNNNNDFGNDNDNTNSNTKNKFILDGCLHVYEASMSNTLQMIRYPRYLLHFRDEFGEIEYFLPFKMLIRFKYLDNASNHFHCYHHY